MFKYFNIFIFKYLFAFIVFFRTVFSNTQLFESILIDNQEIIFEKYSLNEDDFYFYIDFINYNLKDNSIFFKKSDFKYKKNFREIFGSIEEIFYDSTVNLNDIYYSDYYLKISSKNIRYVNSIILLKSINIKYGNKTTLKLNFSSDLMNFNEKDNIIYLKNNKIGYYIFEIPFFDLRINLENETIWFMRLLDDIFGTKLSFFNYSNSLFGFDFSVFTKNILCFFASQSNKKLFFNLELRGKFRNDDKLILNYYYTYYFEKNNVEFKNLFHLYIDKFDDKYILYFNNFINYNINDIFKEIKSVKIFNVNLLQDDKYKDYLNKYYLNNYKSVNTINYNTLYIKNINLGFSFYKYENEKYIDLYLIILNLRFNKDKIYFNSIQSEKFFSCFNFFNIFFLEKEDNKIIFKLPILNIFGSKHRLYFSLNYKKIDLSTFTFNTEYVFSNFESFVEKIDFNKIRIDTYNKIKNCDIKMITQYIESYEIGYNFILNSYKLIIIKDIFSLHKIDVGFGNNYFEVHLKNNDEIYIDLNINFEKFILDFSCSINSFILGWQFEYEFNENYNINCKLMIDHDFVNNKKNCYSFGIDIEIEMWIISINKNTLSWNVTLRANMKKIKEIQSSIRELSNNFQKISKNIESLAKADD